MAKIVLGKRPAGFKKTVKVPMLDGTEGDVPVVYKYRTLTEFGTFIDEFAKDTEEKVKAEQAEHDAKRAEAAARGETYSPPPVTNEDIRKHQAKAHADYLMRILDGWELDVEFSAEAVLQMCDELPAAAPRIIDGYRIAITEGRLGN